MTGSDYRVGVGGRGRMIGWASTSTKIWLPRTILCGGVELVSFGTPTGANPFYFAFECHCAIFLVLFVQGCVVCGQTLAALSLFQRGIARDPERYACLVQCFALQSIPHNIAVAQSGAAYGKRRRGLCLEAVVRVLCSLEVSRFLQRGPLASDVSANGTRYARGKGLQLGSFTQFVGALAFPLHLCRASISTSCAVVKPPRLWLVVWGATT